jgi:hypothetical protein
MIENFPNLRICSRRNFVTGLARRQGITIISTSPALRELPALDIAVRIVFRQLANEQRIFGDKHLFGSFGRLCE